MYKLWYIHTMKYYSAIKRNEIEKHATKWVNLESSMLSKRSQTLKVIYNSIYMKYLKQINPQRQNTDWWLPGTEREGKEKDFEVMEMFWN